MNWKECRNNVAAIYVKGRGIEIGALAQPVVMPPGAQVKYVDLLSREELKRLYPDLKTQDFVVVDIIDDGEKLSTIEDGTQDFVIANHFLEHCQNPIMAMQNMIRVLKADGILYLAVPDKNYTFDRDRPATTWEHCLKDYEAGPEWSRDAHYKEAVRLIEKITEEAEVIARKKTLMDSGYSIHFHVWSQIEMMEFIIELKRNFGFNYRVELLLANEFEVIIVLRKTS